jgi:hypothetical protein
MVEAVVLLKLDFSKDHKAASGVGWGQKYTIDPKGGFLDLYRVEAVAPLLRGNGGAISKIRSG